MTYRLKSCCCGCTLKTGTLCILYFYLIGSVTALVLHIIKFPELILENTKEELAKEGRLSPIAEETINNAIETYEKSRIVCIGLSSIFLVATVLGLYGTHKRKRYFLDLLIISKSFLFVIYGTAVLLTGNIGVLIPLCVAFYLLFVVISFEQELNEEACHYQQQLKEGKKGIKGAIVGTV